MSRSQKTMLRTPEEVREFRRVVQSFPYFLSRYVWIRDGGGTRFSPWPWQVRLAKVWLTRRRVVILKARQLGVSWLAAAYALWVAMTHPGALVLLISQTLPDAQELLQKVKFIFGRLPEWLRPEVGRDNTQTLEFPLLHSSVEALPSTEKAGRGRTARLVIADEHAFHQWAEANMAAIQPTMDADGQFISLSSANGIGNLFADLWAKAGQPGSEWHRVFLPYSMRPGRDGAWYERQKASYTRAWMVHSEYPRDPEEAFVQTGRPVFGKEYLDRHRALCEEPLPVDRWPAGFHHPDFGWGTEEGGHTGPPLQVFALPKPGHRYIAGADVAEGLEHGDYSSLSVLDADLPRPAEVLTLHGHWPPDRFAELIAAVARLYPGLYGIERNNHGLATILHCRRLGVKGLYAERPVLNKQGVEIEPGKLGWLTSSVTKPLMIDGLEEALRLFQIELRDATAIPEMTFYQTQKDGSTGAPAGQWDDRVMRLAIAVQMRKYLPARVDEQHDPSDCPTYAVTRW